MSTDRKVWLIGSGIGSLAAAAFMIRNAGMVGHNITIFDTLAVPGGSLDGAGTAAAGYSLRCGRMLTTDNYECTWGVYKTIPSLTNPKTSVFDETVAFNKANVPHSEASLIDRNRTITDVTTMGFTMADRVELLKLTEASAEKLGKTPITDWLSPPFFETNFWYMWQTTFAFQPWHSAVEFKRYLHRFMKEFSRIETLAGVKRTVYNQYDSLVVPLLNWLNEQGVQFQKGCTVMDILLDPDAVELTVAGLTLLADFQERIVSVDEGDLVIFQNGSMSDASSLGTMSTAPPRLTKADSGGWTLWEKLCEGRPAFGNPAKFNCSIAESYWVSFTVTTKDTAFFDNMQALSGNVAGIGGLVTFKDSNWLMSVVLAHQPQFANQPADVQVFWGYALHPDRIGDFVAKPIAEFTGARVQKYYRSCIAI